MRIVLHLPVWSGVGGLEEEGPRVRQEERRLVPFLDLNSSCSPCRI